MKMGDHTLIRLPINYVNLSEFSRGDVFIIGDKVYARFGAIRCARRESSNNDRVNYIVMIGGTKVLWVSDRDPEFESQFPIFPYFEQGDDVGRISVGAYVLLNKKIGDLEKEISELKDQNNKIISHLETLMIGLGARLYTDPAIDKPGWK